MAEILNQQLLGIRTQVDEIVKELHDLTLQIGHESLAQTVSDLRNRINEPFMFVIVGEVKAGKSSFVNALLDTGREITKAAPQPMTDTIQQILYGEQEEIISINPFLKKILLPVDILQEIAIVDTPGTNTIIDQHQEITERFIPASDLIVFVFEAKNPYRQSAWEFFDYIHADWRKKIVFILQQKDLMPEEDLAVNIQGVIDHAEKKGLTKPHVFAVSAKEEQDGQKERSGFLAVREYIRQNITGGKAPILKLQNNLELSNNLSDRIKEGLSTREMQYQADRKFRAEIKTTLSEHSEKSKRQVSILVENLLAGYDKITRKKEQELAQELSFFTIIRRSFAGIFSKQASTKESLLNLAEKLQTDLETELQDKLNEGVVDLADSIQSMAKVIDLKIQNSETILKNNHAIFSAIGERRSNVLRELQETFHKFLKRTENFTGEDLFPNKQSLAPSLVTGSGLAVVGAIIAAVTNGAVLDITGGLLTAVGLLFAGVSSSVNRNKMLKGFRQEIQNGYERIEKEVTDQLSAYVIRIKEQIDGNFVEFDELLDQEEKQIAVLTEKQSNINVLIQSLEQQVTIILNGN